MGNASFLQCGCLGIRCKLLAKFEESHCPQVFMVWVTQDDSLVVHVFFIFSEIYRIMSRHRDWDIACKVYIGNLGNNASKYELEDAFSKYGPLKNVWVARNPPGFAFVEFEDPRDAEDSVRGLDGTRVCGVCYSYVTSKV